VTEGGIAAFGNVPFNADPRLVFVANLFAVATNRQEPLQLFNLVKSPFQLRHASSQLFLQTHHAFANPQTRPQFTIDNRRQEIPTLRPNTEAMSDRFMDRTIPQAVTLLLREEGGALHVNEIYNRLLEGGFKFTGQNPTISIAVSLNRNTRFRKTAPGTFDLMIRDASRAS